MQTTPYTLLPMSTARLARLLHLAAIPFALLSLWSAFQPGRYPTWVNGVSLLATFGLTGLSALIRKQTASSDRR